MVLKGDPEQTLNRCRGQKTNKEAKEQVVRLKFLYSDVGGSMCIN